MTDPAAPAPRSRGIYLLPNLFTTGGLFAGFYAIIAASAGQYVDACIAVFIAGLLDGVDGRVARMTGTQSEFGTQYDSLADLVSFGLAPALVMYFWSLSGLKLMGPVWGKVGWSLAFLYAACAALRLARFNVQTGSVDKRYFIGLASPAAAALMMSFVWICSANDLSGDSMRAVAPVVTALAALLMVSRFRYQSFKGRPAGERVPFVAILILVGVFVALAIDPPSVLFAIAFLYALSGPGTWVWQRVRRRSAG
ncbi:CDP-diacylglycerol--serine O-phosphatidyltransferase [Pseudomarimonas salicorniae]|uniref:CDP-diacylglycerol--serine O-phosphatidyltransferase n=1 Tax=Pseudomarimonas salicorniae TaxID=2933270 RepID=A0ABT0GHA5_9GAMM|nr:CDP-diacylglycerol--serine O-phosphatidyltransferase [Lysobacter sp. CAU 1642]MCK7593911.1 CDP-diacylglycerol--serine O-phosphatidyltransferase [Lysobacter sp. CAU 1642]